MTGATPPRVAVDMLGGGCPAAVLAGVRRALAADPGLTAIAVGPPALLGEIGADDLPAVPAADAVGPGEDALRAVRARRTSTIRVAAGLVRAGSADAVVSAGLPAATAAAAGFALGPLPGAGEPMLAVTVSGAGPDYVVVHDPAARTPASPGRLAQLALAGRCVARLLHGVPQPVVARLRTGADEADAGPADRWCTPGELVTGPEADVVVAEGSAGEVLVGMLDGATRLPQVWGVAAGPALVLGVAGAVVVVRDGTQVEAVASGVTLAAAAVRAGLVGALAAGLAADVAARRAAAGFAAGQSSREGTG